MRGAGEVAFDSDSSRRARRDFPAFDRLYGDRPLAMLDGPGGTQVPHAVLEAMARCYGSCNTNTGGRFPSSRELDRQLLEAREVVATFLGAEDPATISFGANMTTLTFALSHAIGRLLGEGDEVLITALDHEANRGPWLGLRERGVIVREAALGSDGRLDYEDLRSKLGPRTRLVAVGAASNALGTVNDLPLLRELSRAAGAWLAVDAVHYAPHFVVDVAAMQPDFLLCSAYKFYGPHVGILYTRAGLLVELPTDRLCTQYATAPQRIETGTLNHAAIVGTRAAIEYLAGWGRGEGLRERIVTAMQAISRYEHGLAAEYAAQVAAIDGVRIWGPPFDDDPRAPTVSITLERMAAPAVAAGLGERGICVWDGHFYAARAVEALGLAERGGLLRVGFSMYNADDDLQRLLEALRELAAGGGH